MTKTIIPPGEIDRCTIELTKLLVGYSPIQLREIATLCLEFFDNGWRAASYEIGKQIKFDSKGRLVLPNGGDA